MGKRGRFDYLALAFFILGFLISTLFFVNYYQDKLIGCETGLNEANEKLELSNSKNGNFQNLLNKYYNLQGNYSYILPLFELSTENLRKCLNTKRDFYDWELIIQKNRIKPEDYRSEINDCTQACKRDLSDLKNLGYSPICVFGRYKKGDYWYDHTWLDMGGIKIECIDGIAIPNEVYKKNYIETERGTCR